jgi:predicted ester cyclase
MATMQSGIETHVDGRPAAVDETHDNLQIIRDLVEEFVNKGNVDYAYQVWDPEYQWHPGDGVSPTMDRESHSRDFRQLRSTFPDLHLTVEDMVAQGDKVVTRFRLTGTQLGPLEQANGNSIGATGQKLSWTGITVHRLENGRVVEGWINYDRAGIDEQLGWRA